MRTKIKLGDLGKIITGKTPPTKISDNWNGDIMFITPKDIQSGKNILKTERYITKQGIESVKSVILPPNAVCVSCIGNIGYVGMTTKTCITNQQINSIIVNEKNDANYTYYLIKSLWPMFKKYEGQSTALSILNKYQFSNIEVDVPTVDEQKKIASVLVSIDNLIENNNAINDNLQQQAFARFGSMFPNITDGERTIGDYITPRRGKNLLSKDAMGGEVPVVAGGLEPATFHNVANTIAPVLTISASGANAGFVNLWHIPVWCSDSSFIDFTMTNNVLFWYVLLKRRQKEIFDSQTGSAQPHIYPQHIAAMRISELDNAVIEQYVEEVTPLFKLIGANMTENIKLSSLRDVLLPKLMSGEIDVSNIEI